MPDSETSIEARKRLAGMSTENDQELIRMIRREELTLQESEIMVGMTMFSDAQRQPVLDPIQRNLEYENVLIMVREEKNGQRYPEPASDPSKRGSGAPAGGAA